MLTKQQPYQRLSDDELRQELRKHGFPNLPITETTRNILIKKLQQCQGGRSSSGGRNGQTSSRRDTKFNRQTLPVDTSSANYRQQQHRPLATSGVAGTTPPTSQTRRLLVNTGQNVNDLQNPNQVVSSSTANCTGGRSTMPSSTSNHNSNSMNAGVTTAAGASRRAVSSWFLRSDRGYDEASRGSSTCTASSSSHNSSNSSCSSGCNCNNINHRHQQQEHQQRPQTSPRSKIHVPPPIIAIEAPQVQQPSYDWDLSGDNGGGGKSDNESPPQVVSRLLKLRDINLRRPPVSTINTNLMNSYMQTDSDSDGGGPNGSGGGGGASALSSSTHNSHLSSSMGAAQRYIMMATGAASNTATATLNHYRSSSGSNGILGMGLSGNGLANSSHQQPPYYHHHHHQSAHHPPTYHHHHASHYHTRYDRLSTSASKNVQFLNLKHKFQQSSIPFLLMSSMGLFFGVLALLYLNKPPDISSTMTEKSTTFVLCDTFRLRDFQLQQQQASRQWNGLVLEQASSKETEGNEGPEEAPAIRMNSDHGTEEMRDQNNGIPMEIEMEEKSQKKEDELLDPFEELRRSQDEWLEERTEEGQDSDTAMMEMIVMQPSVNCIEKDLLTNAIHLNRELMKLLQRNTEAHYCRNPEINPTVSGREFIKYLHQKLLFVSKMNGNSLLRHLQASLYLIEKNPQWKIIVVNNKSLINGEMTMNAADHQDGEATNTWSKGVHSRQEPLAKEAILVLEFGLVKPYLPLQCVLRHKMQRFIFIIGSVFFLTVMSLLLYGVVQFVRRRRHLHQLQVDNFALAIVKELMVQAVNHQQQLNANKSLQNDSSNAMNDLNNGSQTDIGGGEVIINHLRDKLLTINRRRSHLKAWNDALQRLEINDSRIHFDTILKNGELFRTMKWIETCPPISSAPGSPSPASPMNSNHSLSAGGAGGGGVTQFHHHGTTAMDQQQQQPPQYPATSMGLSAAVRRGRKKEWQSPAFDNLNNTFEPPTPCLKIRHMFDSTEVNNSDLKQSIILAILEKVGPLCRINDIQLDLQTCCVYIRCATEADAGIVHREINGLWFDNHLVSIKFLRLQRYLTRFPQKVNGNANNCITTNTGS